MPQEIERKYLVRDDRWCSQVTRSTELRQGYLALTDDRSVRVRIGPSGATLTVKTGRGVTRTEVAATLTTEAAERLLDEARLGTVIVKTRHLVPVDDLVFEVDEFHGDNAGLVVAEVELPTVDTAVPRPAWLGTEVTDDPRYLNASLARRPYRDW